MWNYERRLQYPVNITRPNAKIAQIIISQYGGPDGEAAASFRYLSQRYSMPYRKVAGLLTDIGTEELAHLEMVGAIVRQLTKGLSAEELEAAAKPVKVYEMPPIDLLTRSPAAARTNSSALQAKAMKLDPAVMASPFISTIVDALSLLVYFLFAKALLGV